MSTSESRWMRTTAAILALVISGCAGSSSPQLDAPKTFSDFIDVAGATYNSVTGDITVTVDINFGGSSDGAVFRRKNSPAGTQYYWTVEGDVPAGVSKYPLGDAIPSTIPSETFALKGVPTACGQYPLTFTVHTYPAHLVVAAALPLKIIVGGTTCAPPQITTTPITLFTGFQNSRTIGLTGGTPPYKWTVIGTATIAGMDLDRDTGVLSGTPTEVGDTTLSVRVTDDDGRTDTKEIDATVLDYTLDNFTGTWSGIITQGYFEVPNTTPTQFAEIKDERLSLLIGSPTTPPGGTGPANPIVKGTLGYRIINPVSPGMSFQPSGGFTDGLFNGFITQLNWHFTCNPDPNIPKTLNCTGHHVGAPKNTRVTLQWLRADQQDTQAPKVDSSVLAADGTSITVTFSEPMSGSAAIAMTGAGAGPVTFTDPSTAFIPLAAVNSTTPYTLFLNPTSYTGPNRFMDVAGNPLPEKAVPFTTGIVNNATLTITKTGTGTVTVDLPPGATDIPCNTSQTSCSFDIQRGTPVTLSADVSSSDFGGWGGACSGTGTCPLTLTTNTDVTATFDPIPNYLLTVNISSPMLIPGGYVTASPSGTGTGCDNAPLPCTWTYQRGTIVTMTVTVNTGYAFGGWSDGCTGTADCTVTMTSAQTRTATFVQDQNQLTVNKSGNGSGTVTSSPAGIACGTTCPSTLATFDSGTSVTLTATAATGSTFTGWNGSGCSGTGTCTVTMSAAQSVTATFTLNTYALSVTKSGNGTGTVSSSPAGITCGSTCSANFDYLTSVTLTASAATGYSFTGWSGAGCSGTGTCVMTMDAAKSVTATFTINTYTLTVNKIGTGAGSVTSNPTGLTCSGNTCTGTFNFNTQVTLTASPTSGSTFTGWGSPCSGTGTCILAIDSAKSVSATFTLIPTYALSVTKPGTGSGTVTSSPAGINCGSVCSASFSDGTPVTLTAVSSDVDSVFAGWSGDCTADPCTVTMSAARSVTATFNTQPTFPLNLTISGTGSGTVVSTPSGINCTATCTGNFAQGQNVSLTATPSAGSTFTGWSGACSGTGTCLVPMSAAQSVTATFTIQSYTLTVATSGGTGTVTSNVGGISCPGVCAATFMYGTQVTLTATAGSGSVFVGWNGACTSTPCVVTVTSSQTATASFAIQTFALTVNRNGTGTGAVTSSPAGISCGNGGTLCTVNFNQGALVTLTATAAAGSTFTGWSGSGCSGTGTCIVTMSAAQSVTATFTAQMYTLTVSRTGSGTGTVTSNSGGISCGTTCTGSFAYNTTVTLTATPATGSAFTGWAGCTPSGSTCTLTITADTTVTASFALQYALTVTVNGFGTVSSTPVGISACSSSAPCTANFVDGTVVSLTAAPGTGYSLDAWGGACSGNGSCTVTMTTAQSVTATFINTSGINQPPTATTVTLTRVGKPQYTDPIYARRYAFPLTGTDPEGGPLTFRITSWPTYQEIGNPYSLASGVLYQLVNVVNSTWGLWLSNTSSVVNGTTGDVTGSPYFVYTPIVCHVTSFPSDSFQYVAIDDQGLVSAPATITINFASNTCNHPG